MFATAHYHTTNTAHVACLRALGFRVSVRNTESIRTGNRAFSFTVQPEVLDSTGTVRLDVATLMQNWKAGVIKQQDPLHPWMCGLRALHNYKALLTWLKEGRQQRLVAVCSQHATQYVTGETLPSDFAGQMIMRTNDLALAAALGTIGIPVISIEGGEVGRALFVLPVMGYELMQPALNLCGRYDARAIVPREQPGSETLLIERDNPAHPLSFAMRAIRSYKELVQILQGKPTQLLLQHGEQWQRTSLLPGDPAGIMFDRAAEAIGVPVRKL